MDIAALRRQLGFSKTELSRVLSVTWKTVNRWEAGCAPRGVSRTLLAAILLAVEEAGAERVRARLFMGVGPLFKDALTAAAYDKS